MQEFVRKPFRLMLVGPSQSGKTTIIANLFERIPGFIKRFRGEIMILSLTAHVNKSYHKMNDHYDLQLRNKHVRHKVDESDIRALRNWMEEKDRDNDDLYIANDEYTNVDDEAFLPVARDKKYTPKLIILDDVVGKVGSGNREIENIGTYARHFNASLIACVQHFHALASIIRSNESYVVLTNLNNKEVENVAKEYTPVDMTKVEFKRVIKHCLNVNTEPRTYPMIKVSNNEIGKFTTYKIPFLEQKTE